MTQKEFIEILKEKEIKYKINGDSVVITRDQGFVYLNSLTSLPENTKFTNNGSVYLSGLTSLPESTKFNNSGAVTLNSLTSLSENTKFTNNGSVYLSGLTSLPENTKFNNKGFVNLNSLTSLSESTKFNNKGYVNLNSLTSLPENTKFTNNGGVYLSGLTSLPENTKFNNKGFVNLNSLTSLSENTQFNNSGAVNLHSLNNKNIKYQNKEYLIKVVDGYTMLILNKKTVGENTIYKSKFFKGGEVSNLETVYIAERYKYTSHGKTIKEAVEGVNFKYLQETFDLKKLVSKIKTSKKISIKDYRLLTGACQLGCEEFVKSKNIKGKFISLEKALKITKGKYGHDNFAQLFSKYKN